MFFRHTIEHILRMGLAMSWEMLWPITLGLLLSAVVQALVPRHKVAEALGKNDFRGVVLASGMGAASSSCSYAATALARAFFQKGATLANSIIFEFGSTNLVIDLGVVMFALLGWQFLAAQYVGAALMIAILSLLFRFTLRPELEQAAYIQAERGIAGNMEGHAGMDMSLPAGPLLKRSILPRAVTAVSHFFYMDILSLLPDLVLGIFIASVLGALVPDSLWRSFFFSGNPTFGFFWGPIVAPLISMASFVCSIGNVPLAVVLWQGGISFGGVISFIFADLLILPIFNIYRKYYGLKVAMYLFAVSYVAMAVSGILVELIFRYLGIIPAHHGATALQIQQIRLNYTAALNALSLFVLAFLGWRFLRTGGAAMLKQMNEHCGSCHATDF